MRAVPIVDPLDLNVTRVGRTGNACSVRMHLNHLRNSFQLISCSMHILPNSSRNDPGKTEFQVNIHGE